MRREYDSSSKTIAERESYKKEMPARLEAAKGREISMASVSKAVVTVLGFDRKGIIAQVSNVLFERGINILDISQTILDGYFNMVMIVDLSEPACQFAELQTDLNRLGEKLGVQIRIQKSEIFEAMHQI